MIHRHSRKTEPPLFSGGGQFYRWLVMLSLLICLAACAHPKSIKISAPEKRVSLSGGSDIRPILLVADNQFNFYFTDPIILRNRAADYITHVAIRPPQLDVFADDLFSWILSKNGPEKYVIHLGDATNIACVSEWDRFSRVMEEANEAPGGIKGWVMAPGNHDAYLYGVTGGGWGWVPFNNVGEQWVKACSQEWPIKNGDVKPEWRLTKNALLDKYLERLRAQGNEKSFPNDLAIEDVPDTDIPSVYKQPCDDKKGECKLRVLQAKEKQAFAQKVVYVRYAGAEKGFDYGEQHKSFIVQLLNLSAGPVGKQTYAILIDTTDYSQVPANIRGGLLSWLGAGINAGTTGMISEHQQRIVDALIDDIKRQGADYIIMGHHPIDKDGKRVLDKKSSDWLLKRTSKETSLGYISAHTHSGYVRRQAGDSPTVREHEEINVGSSTDWPIEVRTLENEVSEGATTHNIVSRLIREGGSQLPQVEECSALYNYSSSDYRYDSYHKGDWRLDTSLIEHEKTLDTILVTYIRLFENLDVASYITVKELVAEAKELLGTSCLKCDGAKDCIHDSEDCRKEKRKLAMRMEQVDECLQGATNWTCGLKKSDGQDVCPSELKKYPKRRRDYGVCQAVWASQAEFIITDTDSQFMH